MEDADECLSEHRSHVWWSERCERERERDESVWSQGVHVSEKGSLLTTTFRFSCYLLYTHDLIYTTSGCSSTHRILSSPLLEHTQLNMQLVAFKSQYVSNPFVLKIKKIEASDYSFVFHYQNIWFFIQNFTSLYRQKGSHMLEPKASYSEIANVLMEHSACRQGNCLRFQISRNPCQQT